MSDEGFLTRWSRRKRDAVKESDQASAPAADRAKGGGAEIAAPNTAPVVPVEPQVEFDVASLPSLESIGANSDIRAFLAAGVPAHLRQAALRRAWSSDPAIRDFIGLSENAWDFNAQAVPGFGSIEPAQVAKLVRHLAGDQPESLEREPNPQPEAVVTSSLSPANEAENAAAEKPLEGECNCEQDPSPSGGQLSKIVPSVPLEEPAAAQNESGGSQVMARLEPPRHGGALPE